VFKFSVNPAAITVTQGIQHAFTYLGESWRKWLPFVVVLGIAQFVVYLALGSIRTENLYTTDPYTGELQLASDYWDKLRALLVLELLSAGISLVATWAFAAIAITGLRGTQLTGSYIVRRGLLALVVSIIASLVVVSVAFVWAIFLVASPGLGLLLLVVVVPGGIYVAIRYVTFTTLAVFDGFGVIESFRETWRLSQGAVLRLIGWFLMNILIGIGFSIVSAPLGMFGAVGGGLSGAVQGVYSAFAMFFLAVLYESQRARNDPTLYPFAPGYGVPPAGPYPGYPGAAGPYPAYPQSPYGPGAYPAGPYAPGAAPQWPPQAGAPQWPPAQAGAPQWPAPQWPPQAGAPQWPPQQWSGAPAPLWGSNQPGQPPAAPQPNVPAEAPGPNQLSGQAEQPPAKPRRTRRPPETPGS
jgi:hypothetical protein